MNQLRSKLALGLQKCVGLHAASQWQTGWGTAASAPASSFPLDSNSFAHANLLRRIRAGPEVVLPASLRTCMSLREDGLHTLFPALQAASTTSVPQDPSASTILAPDSQACMCGSEPRTTGPIRWSAAAQCSSAHPSQSANSASGEKTHTNPESRTQALKAEAPITFVVNQGSNGGGSGDRDNGSNKISSCATGLNSGSCNASGKKSSSRGNSNGTGSSNLLFLNVYGPIQEGMWPLTRLFCSWFVTHTGVQVSMTEEFCFNGGGIKVVPPGDTPGWDFLYSIPIGDTCKPRGAKKGLRGAEVGLKYRAGAIRLFHRNCNHFTEDFLVSALGVGCPRWVNLPSRILNILLLQDFFCRIPPPPTAPARKKPQLRVTTALGTPADPLSPSLAHTSSLTSPQSSDSASASAPLTAAPTALAIPSAAHADSAPVPHPQPADSGSLPKEGRKWHRPVWVKKVVLLVKKIFSGLGAGQAQGLKEPEQSSCN